MEASCQGSVAAGVVLVGVDEVTSASELPAEVTVESASAVPAAIWDNERTPAEPTLLLCSTSCGFLQLISQVHYDAEGGTQKDSLSM